MKRAAGFRIGHVALVAALLATPPVAAEYDELRRDVEFLASEELEGRLTGTKGERQAAKYIERALKELGAEPLPGLDGYRQSFEFTAGTRDAGSSLRIQTEGAKRNGKPWKGTDRVRALSFSDNGTVTGQVVFAGYGLVVPDEQDFAYDSYYGLDLEDKIVVVLRYFPEETENEIRDTLARYSGLRYKALQARERGAKALLVVTGPNSPNAGKTIESTFDVALSDSGILAASISGELGRKIFDAVEGKTLAEAQSALDTANPHETGFEIPGLTLTLDVKVERERRTGHNVVGVLPASPGSPNPAPSLVLGAHYDHLGHGKQGNSLAKKDEAGNVHIGADDNASGVAAVLAAGRRLAGSERERPIVLAFWTGEELGLLGSSHFAKSDSGDASGMFAYLNFDMVGRMQDNKLVLQGAGSSSAWPGLIERANVAAGFDVRMQEDPYLPTDSTAFYQAGVPTLNFFTGSHEDYHRPSDSAERINYEDLDRIVDFAVAFTRRLDGLDEAPDYVKVARTTDTGGSRDTVRAYTGTIPDYTTEVEGLRLSGVIEDGPADRAGLREGDVIVEFAGRTITNIYDYTYALDAVKIDEPIQVVCMRDGERVEVTVTPTARP